MKKIYIASPLFTKQEQDKIDTAVRILRNRGFSVFSPKDHQIPNAWKMRNEDWAHQVFYADKTALDEAEIVVALDYGYTADSGTSWEIGYAYAKNKYVVVIPMTPPPISYSLMLHFGCSAILNSIWDLYGFDFNNQKKEKQFNYNLT